LDEGGGQLLRARVLGGEAVGGEFVAARPEGAERCGEEERHGPRQRKEQQRSVRRGGPHAERPVEARLAGEPAEERESGERSDQGNDQPLADMLQPKVPELVSQHGLDLRGRELLEQGVEEYDALVVADAGEVRIAVGGAAGAVDDEDAARAEAAAREQRLDAALERSVFER